MTPKENENLIADVERELEAEREFAMASPMPEPESAAGGVYCESSCHEIKPKYGVPKTSTNVSGRPKETTRRYTLNESSSIMLKTRHYFPRYRI